MCLLTAGQHEINGPLGQKHVHSISGQCVGYNLHTCMKQRAILDKARTPWGTKYRTTVSIRGIKHWDRALTTYTGNVSDLVRVLE